MIGRWFEDALNANVFNTKTGKGIDLGQKMTLNHSKISLGHLIPLKITALIQDFFIWHMLLFGVT